jgi:hypothetical protein|tara:strand:- start:2464 stop:2775 length:312 start_codon:yes stop_codon:yes gene_type:complete
MFGKILRGIFGDNENVREVREGPDELFEFLLRVEFEKEFEYAIELSRIPDSEKTEMQLYLLGMFRNKYKPLGRCPSAAYLRASDFQRRSYDGIHKGICRAIYD